MSKISLTEAKRAQRKAHQLRREIHKEEGCHPSDRCLFRRGLITRREYVILTDPSTQFGSRWWSGGGRYYKRRLSKIRRRAWKQRPRRSLMGIESECNWKGT